MTQTEAEQWKRIKNSERCVEVPTKIGWIQMGFEVNAEKKLVLAAII